MSKPACGFLMSKERMQDLLNSLQKYGWEIEPREDETFSDLFVTDNDDAGRFTGGRGSSYGR